MNIDPRLLDSIGNFDYFHEGRKVIPVGLVETSSLVLKMYNMVTELKPTNPVENARKFLKAEIKKGKINPLTGMGFAILSRNNLNIALWDDKCPILPKNNLYDYTSFPKEVKRLDLNKDGAFCIWELGIVAHEKDAWKKYLISGRTKRNKERYLNNFMEGDL